MIVYRITCSVNGKVYIGITRRTPTIRLKEHLDNAKRLRKDTRPLYNAMRKHPDECWSIEVLATASSREELTALEIRFISEHRSTDRTVGYNATLGGDGVNGLVWTAEMRQQASKRRTGAGLRDSAIQKLKALHRDPEYSARATSALRQHKHGPDHYRKIAEKIRGRKHSDDARSKISAALKGKKKSPQHIAKSAASRRGMKKTIEQIEKSARFHRGRTRSAETRAKMSAAMMGNTNFQKRKLQEVTCAPTNN